VPAIHDYWRRRFVTPKLEACGFASAEDLLLEELGALCRYDRRTHVVVSLGSGGCHSEVLVASRLLGRGRSNFRITCVEPNPHRLAGGHQFARRHGVLPWLGFAAVEPLRWQPAGPVSAYYASDCLTRLAEPELLLDRIQATLQREGLLVAQERIGRNRHSLWPEVAAVVARLWRELPERYRYDHTARRLDPSFANPERGRDEDDGARAQDLLPALLERFHFQAFVAYGSVIDPFVDRAFGPNFDPHRAVDRGFIDELAVLDEAAIDIGILKPTHMIAALRREPVEPRRFYRHRSPEFCVRHPGPAAGRQAGRDDPALATLLAPVLGAAASLRAESAEATLPESRRPARFSAPPPTIP
jgi:hypothetical protein